LDADTFTELNTFDCLATVRRFDRKVKSLNDNDEIIVSALTKKAARISAANVIKDDSGEDVLVDAVVT